MQPNLEIEYKVLITSEQYNDLVESYDDLMIYDQWNYYYDTEPSLKERQMGCRIREVNGKFIFTLKQKTAEGQLEYEFELEEENIEDPRIVELQKQLNIGPLHFLAEAHTLRLCKDLKYATLCIDYNEYNGLKDYEVEFELAPNTKFSRLNEFKAILNSVNIPYVANKQTKLARLMNSLNK